MKRFWVNFFVIIFLSNFFAAEAQSIQDRRNEQVAISQYSRELKERENKLELSANSKHFKDKSGSWQPINTKLVALKNDNKFDFACLENTYELHLGRKVSSPIKFSVGQNYLQYIPINVSMSEGKIEDNVMIYHEAWPYADLKYTVFPDFLKEEIILNSPKARNSYEFELELGAVKYNYDEKSGRIIFTDQFGEEIFFIERSFAIDAEGHLGEVSTKLEKRGSATIIKLILDEAWFKSKERVYPIIIDPTITLVSQGEATFTRDFVINFPQTISWNCRISGYNMWIYQWGGSFKLYAPGKSNPVVYYLKEDRGEASYSGTIDVTTSELGTWRMVVDATKPYAFATGTVTYHELNAVTDIWGEQSADKTIWHWVDTNDVEDGYKIYRAGTDELIGQVGPNITTWTSALSITEIVVKPYAWNYIGPGASGGLDLSPPTISELTPQERGRVTIGRPTISAKVADLYSGVNFASVETKLDGITVSHNIDQNTGIITFSPLMQDLSVGWHEVSLAVIDKMGNRITKTWLFLYAAEVKLEPNVAYVAWGEKQKFFVFAKDQAGNWQRLAFPDCSWSVSGGIGTVDATGLFKANNSNSNGNIIANLGPISASAEVRMPSRKHTVNGVPVRKGNRVTVYNSAGTTITSFYALDDWLVWDGRVSGSSVANNGLYIIKEDGGSSQTIVLFDTSTGPEITVSGSGTDLTYNLSKYAFLNTYIADHDGNVIRYLENGVFRRENISYNLVWDGRDDFGELVSAGEYFGHITGVDMAGNPLRFALNPVANIWGEPRGENIIWHWTDTNAYEQGYKVYKVSTGELLATVGPNITTWTSSNNITQIEIRGFMDDYEGPGAIGGIDQSPPVIVDFTPQDKERVEVGLPQISVTIQDPLSGIDPNSIETKLDRNIVSHSFDPDTGIVKFAFTEALTVGWHEVSLEVADRIGNRQAKTWSFIYAKEIKLEPSIAYLSFDGQQQFFLILKDEAGFWNRIKPEACTWTVDGGVGYLDKPGLLKTNFANGTGSVTASYGSVSASASILMPSGHKSTGFNAKTGKSVRILDIQNREVASFVAWDNYLAWDGRTSSGKFASGSYKIKIDGLSDQMITLSVASEGAELARSGFSTNISYTLTDNLSDYAFVNILISDKFGNIVRHFENGVFKRCGSYYVDWDYRDDYGKVLPIDEYDCLITGVDLAGNKFLDSSSQVEEKVLESYSIEYEYNDKGNMIKKIEELGFGRSHVTEYEYDERNAFVSKEINRNVGPTNETIITQYEYDDLGYRTAIIDAEGKKTVLTNDGFGRVMSIVHQYEEGYGYKQIGPTERISYFDASNRIETSLWADEIEQLLDKYVYQYDSEGNLCETNRYSSSEDKLIKLTSTEYDSRSLPIITKTWLTDTEYVSSSFEYDALGRLVKQTINSDPSYTHITYDNLERSQIVTDENENQIKSYYDPDGNLLKVCQLLLGEERPIVSYKYDFLGRQKEICNYKENGEERIVYTYGLGDKVLSIEYLDDEQMATQGFEYDKQGNLVKVLQDGITIKILSYDELNRLIGENWDQDDVRITYTYDRTNNLLESLYSKHDIIIKEEYTYDPLDRVIVKSLEINGRSFTLAYDYDLKGRLSAIAYPNNSYSIPIEYQYDEWDRLTGILGVLEGGAGLPGVEYDRTGFIQQLTYGNGISTIYTPDDRRRVKRIATGFQGQPLLNLNYEYDNVDNILRINDTSYSYDYRNRLIRAENNNEIITYEYDWQGNRISMAKESNGQPAFSHNYTYASSNRLVSANGVQYSYDSRGNQIGKGSTNYLFDADNRLLEVRTGDTTLSEFLYNPAGIRVASIVGEEITYYVVDGNRVLYEQVGDDPGNSTQYIFMGPRLIAKVEGGSKFFYHSDHLGSTRVITDEQGQVISEFAYDPFGSVTNQSGSPENYKYTGKPEDSSIGLYYYGARYYDPEIGRFISQDPAKDGLNWYAYCNSNPLKNIDPNGRTTITAALYLRRYEGTMESLSKEYNNNPTLLASVVWNENKFRNIFHSGKDILGLAIRGNSSLGICQVQLSTAAFLDTNPNPKSLRGIESEKFNNMKKLALDKLSFKEKMALARRLDSDDQANLEYAAKYISLIQQATGIKDPQIVLSNYNRGPDSWSKPPSNTYGIFYGEFRSYLPHLRLSWTNLFGRALNDLF